VRYIDAAFGNFQALEALLHITVIKEDTTGGMELQFMGIIRAQIGQQAQPKTWKLE
jgi:hypothetical protein